MDIIKVFIVNFGFKIMKRKGHLPHELENIFPLISEKNKQVTHYTCNAPSEEILEQAGIKAIGGMFGCAINREVVKIPFSFYENPGRVPEERQQLILASEKILRDLGSKPGNISDID